MSKLPNAPLVEVIFELKWNVNSEEQLQKADYLVGDLFPMIKEDYPFRQPLVPAGIPANMLVHSPVQRFRKFENDYPLIQVGPGLLTLNVTDEKYFWDDFYACAESLCNVFFEIYEVGSEEIVPSLSYFDFFMFDFEKANVNDFLKESFNIEIKQSFLQSKTNPFNLDVGFYFEVDLGRFSLTLKKGTNQSGAIGIVMQTSIHASNLMFDAKEPVIDWLGKAHAFSSKNFKEITKGALYKSFQ